MSAFAAFGKQQDVQDYCYPHPLEKLTANQVETSSFEFTIDNSLYTPRAVVLGLLPSQYLVVNGRYNLTVLRGICLVNNVHKVPTGMSHPVITSSVESLPTLAVPDNALPLPTPKLDQKQLFPECATVIELANLQIGLDELGHYCPLLENLYKLFPYEYSFDIIQKQEDALSTIHFNQSTLRTLNGMCPKIETIAVFGVPNSGKKTIARTLLNNVVLSSKKVVAYLDLDPSSIDGDNPGCLSLRVLRKPVFGEFSFRCEDTLNQDHVHRYYGFESFEEKPRFYLRLCNELLAHYRTHFEPNNIPLVVKYPSWIKGRGKDLLIEFSHTLNPRKMAYLTHNDALYLEDFKPDAFEESDHPDADVISGLQCKDYSIIRGVRRKRAFTKNELLFRNKLLYFHRNPDKSFDFTKPLLHNAPFKFPFKYVSAISVLNLDTDADLTPDDVYSLVEAMIMGIFITKSVENVPENLYISASKFIKLESTYVGACMVHLVDAAEKLFHVYLRDEEYIADRISSAIDDGLSVVLARGEGQIPAVEFTNGLTRTETDIPYVSFDPKQKLGGIWKVRRNIGRRNQG